MQDPAETQPTSFDKDNFTSRQTTGHNLFDPESLITGKEAEKGFTYDNSERNYPSSEVREAIIRGDIAQADVPMIAPRQFKNGVGDLGEGVYFDLCFWPVYCPCRSTR